MLDLRVFHLCDTFAPADPDRWPVEFVATGLNDVYVATGGW
jgi:hypothetical protein